MTQHVLFPHTYYDFFHMAVFGYRNLGLEMNWSENSKSKMERKWSPILIQLFGCAWYLVLESKGYTEFQFLFGCMNHGIWYSVDFRKTCVPSGQMGGVDSKVSFCFSKSV
jgi:hypothetical protein